MPMTLAPMSSSMVVKRRHMPMTATTTSGSMAPPMASEAVSTIMATTMIWLSAPVTILPAVSHHRERREARAPLSKAAVSRR